MAAPWPPPTLGALEDEDREIFALRSTRCVLPCDRECLFEVVPATILCVKGRIDEIRRDNDAPLPAHCALRDVGDLVVLPGVVDAGARFGECAGHPAGSRSDCWEGFERGTRACAAGGITTTVDLASLDAPSAAANDIPARAALAMAAGPHADARTPRSRGCLAIPPTRARTVGGAGVPADG
jgi:hypothetical protein